MEYLNKEKGIFLNRDVSKLQFKNLNYKFASAIYEHTNLVDVGYNEKSTQFGSVNVGGEHKKFVDSLFPTNNHLYALKQNPGCHLPEHMDAFFKFRTQYGVQQEDCMRLIFFMEDWKSGHYLEVNYQPVVGWKAGDCVKIESGEPHLSANGGMEPKYTLAITGLKSELCLD
tara:strand:+ start:31 stop:543 length:513 start_codon:yes stop_codon:yes gene_type:complete